MNNSIKELENNLNEKLKREGKLTLGDIYDELGFERVPWADYATVTHVYSEIQDVNDITKKYLVIMDGCKGYGSYVDFVGLFNTRDGAEKAIDECLKYAEDLKINIRKEEYEIFEVDEGWWHYPHQDRYGGTIHTDMPLGGYEE